MNTSRSPIAISLAAFAILGSIILAFALDASLGVSDPASQFRMVSAQAHDDAAPQSARTHPLRNPM